MMVSRTSFDVFEILEALLSITPSFPATHCRRAFCVQSSCPPYYLQGHRRYEILSLVEDVGNHIAYVHGVLSCGSPAGNTDPKCSGNFQRKELPMYRRWKTFLRIAEGRIQLMKDVESDGSACLKACDNMEVRLIPSFNRGRLI
jgi:hypothetical protein